PDDRCADCRRRPRAFRVARAAGLYEGELRRFVHRLKFRRERRLAGPLGRLLVPAWRGCPELRAGQLLVPVPLSPDRLAERGFNQAEELALALGAGIRRPVAADALRRSATGAAQSLRSRAGRAAVREGVFQPFRPGAVAGRRVVLVDDVLTTGSTAEACTLALLRAGAVSVDVLTVAVAVAPAEKVGTGW
ncbi:MAG TPA: ComF family protein, partial [Firmicutes bacterium]|nr:ComF family protein [Bacillota bacterium]